MTARSSAQHFGFDFKERGKRRVVIPFEIYNNLVVVPVTLNGSLPLKFILDSGIRTTILTEKLMSDLLDLSFNRTIELKGPGINQVIRAHVANNVAIEIPGVVGKGQALLVLEEDYLHLSNYIGAEVHGIIGYELFSRFVVEINYRNSTLILHDDRFYEPKRRFTKVPITIEDTKPYVQAQIDQYNGEKIDVKLMVDTGASHALLLEQDASPKIQPPEVFLEANLGRGLGGEILGKLGRIKSLQIDEFVFEDPIASYPDPKAYVDSVFYDREGTIGGELLSRFNVILDYSARMMYLKKNFRFNHDFEFDMSGLEVIAAGRDLGTFKIVNVNKNGPAHAAGLMAGDTILAINGQKVESIKLNYIHRLFHSREGRKIRMIIRRNGDRIRKVFRLERLI